MLLTFFCRFSDPCGDGARGASRSVHTWTSMYFTEIIFLLLLCIQPLQLGVIFQVLLPMPGNTVKYPGNAMGTWYRERLARDGLENCRFRVGSLKLNLPGCYRPLLAFPHNLSYHLQRLAREVTVDDNGERTELTNGASVGEQMSDTNSLALIVNFDLDSSCYATVCLREIMKFDP